MCKVGASRAEELGAVLAWAAEQGNTVAMLTLTARHHAGHSLEDVWDAVQGSWSSVTSGRPWQRMQEDWGVIGWARAVESTHGKNGWHVHLHVVLILEGEQTDTCVSRLGEAMWPRWVAALDRRGFSALRGPGLDIRTGTGHEGGLARYLVKAMAAEVTLGHAKKGRQGGRTPLEILSSVVETGDADDLDLWREWEQASKGRRQLTWSRGLKQMAGLEVEKTDEEIAAETVEGEDVIVFEPDAWRMIAHEQGDLLVTAERWGVKGARAWLRQRGVPFIEGSFPARETVRE